MSNFTFNFFKQPNENNNEMQIEENEANNNNNDQQHLIPKRITLSYEKEVKPILDGTYFETLHGVNKVAGFKKGLNAQSDIFQITNDQNSDVLTGFYEGGLKVWECTLDLMNYLQRLNDLNEFINNIVGTSSSSNNNINILDLGCGHGLAGIYAFLLFNNKMNNGNNISINNHNVKIFFQDLNIDVLKYCTAPNLFLNLDIPTTLLTTSDGNNSNDDGNGHNNNNNNNNNEINDNVLNNDHRFQFWSGDWSYLLNDSNWNEEINKQNGFDLILTADTIYAKPQMKKLAMFLYKTLPKQINSIALVGAKRYYFGTGGNVKDFIDEIHVISNGQLTCKQVAIYEDKQSNIREIILVSNTKK